MSISSYFSASVGRVFDVYRIKIFEHRDREEDVEAKCRHYSGEAGLTYKDCVLTSIKNDFEVSRFNGTLPIYSFTSVENLQRKIGCSPPWFAHEYSLVCNKSLTREDVDVLSTDVWGPFDASEFEDCVRPCVRMEIESRILRLKRNFIGPRERSERGPTKPLLLSTPTKCIQKCQKNHHF